jgi:hypothetical protein
MQLILPVLLLLKIIKVLNFVFFFQKISNDIFLKATYIYFFFIFQQIFYMHILK